MNDLEKAAASESIRQAKAQYWTGVDLKDEALLAGAFTDDAIIDFRSEGVWEEGAPLPDRHAFAKRAVLNDFSRAAHEIVGLACPCRALKEIERHGSGTNRKTCMAAAESAGMRAKSGVLALAGSRSTAHRALSNCAARTRQAAFAMSVTTALSWVGA